MAIRIARAASGAQGGHLWLSMAGTTGTRRQTWGLKRGWMTPASGLELKWRAAQSGGQLSSRSTTTTTPELGGTGQETRHRRDQDGSCANMGPEDNLQKVRKLATDNKLFLIFDECTGFAKPSAACTRNMSRNRGPHLARPWARATALPRPSGANTIWRRALSSSAARSGVSASV